MKGVLRILLKCLIIVFPVLIAGLVFDNFFEMESTLKIILLALIAGIASFCIEVFWKKAEGKTSNGSHF